MPTSVIPGVEVRTLFEPAPALPGATGILGVVGVTDRGPVDPTPVGTFSEFLEVFGPASRHTMPEVRSAFINGVAQAVVARIAPGRGRKAFCELFDKEGDKVVRLEARAEGDWGNRLAARVTPVLTLSGEGVKYVRLELLRDGEVLETHDNLVMDPDNPNYLFDRINDRSSLVVATDPTFATQLPATIEADVADSEARAATALLKQTSNTVVRAEAKRPGRAGNRLAVGVGPARARLALPGPAGAAAAEVVAKEAGLAGTDLRVTVAEVNATTRSIAVTTPGPNSVTRTVGNFTSPAALVALLANDPDIRGVATGDALPVAVTSAPLRRRVDVTVYPEGRDPRVYENIADRAGIVAVNDTLVAFSAVGTTDALPDEVDGVPLSGGRDKGAALELAGAVDEPPLLELVAPSPAGLVRVKVTQATSTLDRSTPVVNLEVRVDGQLVETFTDLTMDPDDPRYLPAVLDGSAVLRAVDLFVPARTTSLPGVIARAKPFQDGVSPIPDDYQEALDRLETAEEADLLIASVANQLDEARQRTVQQQVVAHCTKMADLARNRIGLASVSPAETAKVASILDHADDVRSDHFVLCTPAGSEGAVAGLLSRQVYFDSPTFKTVAALGVEPGHYSDAQLEQLIRGNVLVVNQRRGLGIIVVKGMLTSGRPINVQRTANKVVRDTKATAQRFIGLLNNEGARNALKQQVIALLLQAERDGAIVPSVDGSSPAFTVDVYSTQADFANGIVRIDVACRPVREIAYVQATIVIQN